MGKYTKIKADGGPIKKVRISDKGEVKDVPINTKEYKQYYDSKTLAKASEDPNLLIAAQDLNPYEVKAEKPTWLTFKEEALKNYPESKFRNEYFLPALKPSDLDSLPQNALDEYNKRINNTVAQRLLKERNLDKNWDAKTQVGAFTQGERDIILNSDYGEDLARNVRLYDAELADKESYSNTDNKADLLRRKSQATGDKFRFSNKSNFFDDYINPGVMVGNMASNLGAAPDNWNRGNYLSAIGAVAAPIGVGRLASIGAPTTAQFVNNLVNPLAGTGSLIKGAGKYLTTQTPLKNAYKVNPTAFNPKMDRYYRQILNTNEGIGKELAESLTTKGKVLSPRQLSLTPDEQSKHWFDYNTAWPKGQVQFPNNEIVDYRLSKTSSEFPFFQKGDLYYGDIRNNSLLIESKPELGWENFTPAAIRHTYHPKNIESVPYITNQLKGTTILNNPFDAANVENFNIYEPHWWKGYKQVKPGVKQYGGYINNDMNRKKYADGGPIKGKKKPAIKVSDPTNLNLHAYLDSSNLHNAYLEQLKYNPPQDVNKSFNATIAGAKDYINSDKDFKSKSKAGRTQYFKPSSTKDKWTSEAAFKRDVPEDAPLIDRYKNLTFSTPTETGLWTTPDLYNQNIAPIGIYYGGRNAVDGAWNPIWADPTQPYEYTGDINDVLQYRSKPTIHGAGVKFSPKTVLNAAPVKQKGLNIPSVQYNPKDANPYNKYVVNRYLPTPESPTNPKPYDDIQLYSGHQSLENAGKPIAQINEGGKWRNIMADEYNAIMGSSVQGGTKLENTNYAMGGMIKRKNGSYSKRGLWDNIRANKGSGKEPTKEMLEQEAKIKAKYPDGGPLKKKSNSTYVKGTPYLKNEFAQYSPKETPQYINWGNTDYRNPVLDSDLENNLEYLPFVGTVLGANDASAAQHKYSKNPTKGNAVDAAYETASLFPLGKTLKITKPGAGLVKSSYKYLKLPINAALDAVTDERIININPATRTGSKAAKTNSNATIRKSQYADGGPINTLEGDLISKVLMNRNQDKDFVQRAYAVGDYPNSNMFTSPDPDQFGSNMSHKMSWGTDDKGQAYMYPTVMNPKNEDMKVPNQYADYISSVGYKKATGMPYAMGGRMNQAQQLNAAKMRVGSDAPDGSVWKDIGAGAFGVLEGTLDTVTMGATDALTDAAYKGLQKVGGSDASQIREQDMIHGFSSIGGAAIGAAVNPASGMTAVSQGIKGLGQGVGNINENTQGIGNAISGLSGLTGLIPSGGGNKGSLGQQEMEQMGAAMKMAQGGLMHINEGGTHEQNALGGVPIGPNALVEQGETINNDFVFSDRLKPKGSKRTYAQLSKSVDTKYKLRPDDKLSKEAKQMDLDRLAMQQEAQKDEMSTKYMQKAMACGGKIKGFGGSFQGPISQSMNVTNGQNTMLAMGGNLPNYDYGDDGNIRRSPYNNMVNAVDNGINNVNYQPSNDVLFNDYMQRDGFNPTLEDYNKVVLRQQQAAMGGLMSNFMEQPTVYQNPANLSNQYKYGGNMYGPVGPLEDFNYADTNLPNYAFNPYTDMPQEDFIDMPLEPSPTMAGLSQELPPAVALPWYTTPEGPNMENGQFATGYPKAQGIQINNAGPKVTVPNTQYLNKQQSISDLNNAYLEPNLMGQKQGNAFDKNAGNNQNPYPEVGNTGYLTNLAGNLIKAGMVATSKPPIYNPSLKLNRMNSNPAERLAMQEGRREIQGTKDIIRNNATSSGQYLTNASLMGSSAANKLAGTIGGIRQGYDQQNVGIGNQEAQLNQQITAGNNLAKETFRDNRLNQYNKILDSVIGANQQRFSTDVHANNFQNQVISLLKTGVYHYGKQDEKGMYEILGPNNEVITKMPKVS